MRNRLTYDVVGALVFFLTCGISATASAQTRTIRVVTYNIRCAIASGDPATKLLLCVLLCLFIARPVLAWGYQGHQVVAQIAYNHLDPEVKAKCDALIALNPVCGSVSHSFVSDASWADQRCESWTTYQHYIGLPINLDSTNEISCVIDPTNAVTAINQYTATLQNPNATLSAQATALRYLIHFVGDLHCPTHASTGISTNYNWTCPAGDRGGNDFNLSGLWNNLHSLWDAGGGYLSSGTVSGIAAQVEAAYPYSFSIGSIPDPYDWAWESRELARTNAYVGITKNSTPSTAYTDKVQLTTMQRMAIGGQRLAKLLNLTTAVTLPASATEGDGVLIGQGSVSVSPAPPADLTVSLTSSDMTELTVPASVIIPAGLTNVTFDVTIVDDTELDGSQSATVTATAPGYGGSQTTVTVYDNETARLTLQVPTTVAEGSAPVGATLFASAPPSTNVTVSLSSSDPTEATVPASVILPAGQTSGVFNVTIINDALIDGSQPVTITAHFQNWTDGVASLTVLDNENTNLVVTLPASVREGQGVVTNAGTVRISGTWPTTLMVNLASSDTTELTVPASVTIPAGQTNVTFNVTVIDDAETDGTQPVTVTASATGFADGSAGTTVLDNDLHHFVWAAISSPKTTAVPFSVTIRAQNIDSATLSNYPGPASLSGFGDGGAVGLTPTSSGAFSNGLWTGALTVHTPDTNLRLVANDGAGHNGTSTVFSVLTPFAHWQLGYFGCTGCPQAVPTADPDGDGQDNWVEFLAGMDPTNSISYWRIQANPTNGLAPLLVNFTNNATGSSITNLVWSFGDGSVGSGPNPGHTYTNAGTYSVGLTLFNLNGTATLVASNLITVLPGATVEVAALALLDRWGDLMPASGVAVLVVDTATNGFVDPQPPFPLSAGAAWGTDDRIVGLWNLNSCGDGCLWDQTVVGYTNGITSGQILRLYWFPSLTLASNTVGWTYYGKYTDTNSPPLDGSAPWELPPLESSATLIFFTQSEGGSNPNDAGRAIWSTFLDSDADDIPDYWMLQYFGHATGQASDHSRAVDDADGTGQNNLFKYTAGLDPTNSASVFALRLESVPGQPNQKVLTWKPLAVDRTYAPEFSTNLTLGWSPLTVYDGPVTNGNQVTITDQNAVESNKFYRIKITYP